MTYLGSLIRKGRQRRKDRFFKEIEGLCCFEGTQQGTEGEKLKCGAVG